MAFCYRKIINHMPTCCDAELLKSYYSPITARPWLNFLSRLQQEFANDYFFLFIKEWRDAFYIFVVTASIVKLVPVITYCHRSPSCSALVHASWLAMHYSEGLPLSGCTTWTSCTAGQHSVNYTSLNRTIQGLLMHSASAGYMTYQCMDFVYFLHAVLYSRTFASPRLCFTFWYLFALPV